MIDLALFFFQDGGFFNSGNLLEDTQNDEGTKLNFVPPRLKPDGTVLLANRAKDNLLKKVLPQWKNKQNCMRGSEIKHCKDEVVKIMNVYVNIYMFIFSSIVLGPTSI